MKVSLLLAPALLSLTGVASAQAVIAGWDLSGAPGDQVSTPATLAASFVTGLDMARGAGINPTAANNSISANGWEDLAVDDYFTFGFTVDAGYAVDLAELQISTRSSNTGPANLALRYSVDNFTADLATIVNSGTLFTDVILDLTALPALSGNVEFRLYATNNVSANGGTIGSTGTMRIARYYDGASYLPVEFRGTVGNGTVGTPYCTQGVANSTGVQGQLLAVGSDVRAQNDLTLTASQLPTNAFGYFLTSRNQGMISQPGGSQGVLCLGGNIGRYVGPGQIKNSGATGSFALVLDLNTMPSPQGAVSAAVGETWNFQAWHRDAIGGVPTSNFTTAVTVTFQ
jgi:hypothetical protein